MNAEEALENGMWVSNAVSTVRNFFGKENSPIPSGSDISIDPMAHLTGGGSLSLANGWLIASVLVAVLMVVGMCFCDCIKKVGIGIFVGLAIGVFLYLKYAI